MEKQVKILFNPDHSPAQKGTFFEQLVRKIFETQRYDIQQNIVFTGTEIDLIAKHKDRHETIYIECKAREKLEANDIKAFVFNVEHSDYSQAEKCKYGYFLSTTEFQHHVAGLIEQIRQRHANLL